MSPYLSFVVKCSQVVRRLLFEHLILCIPFNDLHPAQDLARWKNRRRSTSHDLIKKENERKMMEKVMLEEQAASLRRKSIKTYKEIVEEK